MTPNQFTAAEGKAIKLAMSEANDLRLDQLAAAEGHHSDKGYMLGSQADYEAFVAKRNKLSGLSGPPPLTYEEMLHELWYLRRRVKQLEQQLNDASWQTNPDRQGGSFSQGEIDNATAWR